MGRRGPPPKPLAQKKLEGTYRKDRAASNPVQPPTGAPQRPAWLKGEALREWKRVVDVLGDLGVLSTVDGGRLADYCAAHALAIKATRKYEREGLTIRMPSGITKTNPMVMVAKEARAQARLLAAEFGLTPASRTWVNAPSSKPGPNAAPAASTDPAEQALFGRPGLRAVNGGKADGAQ